MEENNIYKTGSEDKKKNKIKIVEMEKCSYWNENKRINSSLGTEKES